MDFYQKNIPTLFQEFQSSKDGISTLESFRRLRKYGFNSLKAEKQKPIIFKFFAQFTETLAVILIIAAVLSLMFLEYRDATILFLIVLINATIGFFHELKAIRILAAFKKILPSYSKVVRDGKIKNVLTTHIVPGDILKLSAGDDAGADARLISAFDLKVNEFSLTGETLPQNKTVFNISQTVPLAHQINTVFMGTSIVSGEGLAIVTATGQNTAFGKIAKKTAEISEKLSPLQEKSKILGRWVAIVAVLIIVFVVIWGIATGKSPLDNFLFALALAASAVPEGLPATVSVALSLGSLQLLKRKALVKKLSAVETLGEITVICTDKTGTLTKNQMKVVEISTTDKKRLYQIFALCNSTVLSKDSYIGDPTEAALLYKLSDDKFDYITLRKNSEKIFEFPFDSKRKMQSVAILENGKKILLAKGAPLEILEKSRMKVSEEKKILEDVENLGKKGLRILGFGFRKLNNITINSKNRKQIEQDLSFIGLVGIEDPPRAEVFPAIKKCQEAKIKVIMITGDLPQTAKAIALQTKIIQSSNVEVLTSDILKKINDWELLGKLRKEVIFARTEPQDKLRIVSLLQKMGEIVAVTGDGVNDAPALKKADIGVAMGRIGTDVAKESADIVLLDDNFATLVYAIEEGRRIYDNLKKFVFYIFVSNAGEFMTVILGLIFKLPLPILAVQILAIDLGTDVLPSLSLTQEPSEKDTMQRHPRSPYDRLINISSFWHLLWLGTLMGLGAVIIFAIIYFGTGNYQVATTASYLTLVITQVSNIMSVRSRKSIFKIGFFSNRWLLVAELGSFILLFAILYIPFLKLYLETRPLPISAWIFAIFWAVIVLMLEEWRKWRFGNKTAEQRK